MTHLDTQELWIQQAVKDKKISIHKIARTENPSDILAKYVTAQVLQKRLTACGIANEITVVAGISPSSSNSKRQNTKYGNEKWWKPSQLKATTALSTSSATANATGSDACTATAVYASSLINSLLGSSTGLVVSSCC